MQEMLEIVVHVEVPQLVELGFLPVHSRRAPSTQYAELPAEKHN